MSSYREYKHEEVKIVRVEYEDWRGDEDNVVELVKYELYIGDRFVFDSETLGELISLMLEYDREEGWE